jgi:hypothetical protein
VIREELARLFTRSERHRRLFARLLIAFGLSLVIFVVGTLVIWATESGQQGGDINGIGDSAFFCAVQLVTISSSIKNPLTPVGKIVDVALEMWGLGTAVSRTSSLPTGSSVRPLLRWARGDPGRCDHRCRCVPPRQAPLAGSCAVPER